MLLFFEFAGGMRNSEMCSVQQLDDILEPSLGTHRVFLVVDFAQTCGVHSVYRISATRMSPSKEEIQYVVAGNRWG